MSAKHRPNILEDEMAITQAQYDEINVGDYVVVVFVWDTHMPKPGQDTDLFKGEVYMDSNYKCIGGYTLLPCNTGTILFHKAAPKPAWHKAKVIKVGETILIRVSKEWWHDSSDQKIDRFNLSRQFSDAEITIIVGEND